jgi:TRAP-type C4-dicarboxylate transport system permease small subunit
MNIALLRAGTWLRRRAENILAALLTAMFVAFLIQIVARYVFNFPVGWTYEVSLLTWLWGVLWGAAFVVTEREEIRFDIVYGALGPGLRRLFTVVSGLALIALYTISLPAVISYVTFMKVEHAPHLRITFDRLFSIYVIFAVASIIRYGWLVVRAVRGEGEATAASNVGAGA